MPEPARHRAYVDARGDRVLRPPVAEIMQTDARQLPLLRQALELHGDARRVDRRPVGPREHEVIVRVRRPDEEALFGLALPVLPEHGDGGGVE